MSHCCCLPRTVTLQRTIPCTSHPEPRSNATRCFNYLPPNVTLVLRLPRNVTLQRTQSRSNATRMLQSPATKCHTGAAPATQRQSPATTCHTAAAPANVPFPAPATQSHAPTLPGCFNHLPPNVTLLLRLPRTVTLQRTIPCTSHPEPRSNATRCFNYLPPNVTLVLRLLRNVTLQRTQSRSNATRMLQLPATKCHTGAAPATQRQSPATTCHTGAAPATQRHTATYHSLHQPPRATLQLEVSRVQAIQFHVYKRANFMCTSEPAPVQKYELFVWTCIS